LTYNEQLFQEELMKISRRSFIATTGLSIAAAAIKIDAKEEQSAVQNPVAAKGSYNEIRDSFNLNRSYIHLATFFIASHPKPVRDAIEKYRRDIDDNPFLVVEHGLFGSDGENYPLQVKKAAAEYLGASPDEIALTTSTTVGLALIYNGMKIRKGQEILTTDHDHYSHHESIRLAVEKNGATYRKIPLFNSFDTISEEDIVQRIRKAITPDTRAIGVTWVHSSSGLKLPISKISQLVQESNRNREPEERILLVVDGVHGLGVEDTTVQQLGCDFLVAGTHKWIFGPRGTGIIWGKKSAWSEIAPTVPTFDSGDVYGAWMDNEKPKGNTQASWVTPGGFLAYEHQWAIADAFRYHLQIGKKRVMDRIHELNTICKSGLAQMNHVELHTPRSPELSAGLICFDVKGMEPEQVVQKLLDKKIIASVSPYGVAYARLAPSLVNNEAEIETTLRAIRELA
jgi:selenocysteine lyase/cysteine desulfurase